MDLETPEGHLTISDQTLSFVPADGGPELTVSLDSDPEIKYERGVYGLGHLVVDRNTIVLKNDQASAVIEELRRPRQSGKSRKADKPEAKTDSDSASAK